MRFNKGRYVEVFSKLEVPLGSWLCAEIISGNGRSYTVKYGISSVTGEATVDRVPRKAIRPCPPLAEGVGYWVPGDHVEVFQDMSWKTATVVKVLGGHKFLVRLWGEHHAFEAHKFYLRVRQSWQDGVWCVVGKLRESCFTMPLATNQEDTTRMPYSGECCFHIEKEITLPESNICPRMQKRKLHLESPHSEVYSKSGQKFRCIQRDGSQQRLVAGCSASLSEKVEAHILPQEHLNKKLTRNYFNIGSTVINENDMAKGRLGHSDDSSLIETHGSIDVDCTASSVGSCSVDFNILCGSSFGLMELENGENESVCSDAESFCGIGNKEDEHESYKNEKFVSQDYRLELITYRSTMKSLFTRGPLSWDDEMMLADLRHALHITDDEHLMEMRNLIASHNRIPVL